MSELDIQRQNDATPRVPLYAFRSPAFEPLWKCFEASVPASLDLHPVPIPERFDGVTFGEPRYWQLMRWIVERRVEFVEANQGQLIASSGCDSVFFGDPVPDLTERLAVCDFVAVNDWDEPIPRLCACLQAMRCTPAVLAYQRAIDAQAGTGSDDTIMNELREMVRWAALPRELYWSHGRAWTGEPVTLPRRVLWAHLNWCIGVPAKMALLAAVQAARGAIAPPAQL
jgi:hypothetical protein